MPFSDQANIRLPLDMTSAEMPARGSFQEKNLSDQMRRVLR